MASKPESNIPESKNPKLLGVWNSRLERIVRKKEAEKLRDNQEIVNLISEIHRKIENVLDADQYLGLDTDDDDEDDLDPIYPDTFSFEFMSNQLFTSNFETIQKHFREKEGLLLTWNRDNMEITVTRAD